jgi:serine phosphatase RsbU (regulator of sigma subunit)
MGIALLVALALLIAAEPTWNQWLRSAWFDGLQMAMPRKIASMPATVVEIDERSIARLGQWPWPRTVLAELVRDIEGSGPAAIGIDILMPDPDPLPERLVERVRQRDPALAERLGALPSSDTELAHAIAAGPVVVGLAGIEDHRDKDPPAPPFVVVDRTRSGRRDVAASIPAAAGVLTNIEELDRAAAGHGAISYGLKDELIRRLPLAVRMHGRLVPSLPVEMLRVALHAPAIRVVADGPAVAAIVVGDLVVPTEGDGSLRIYYSKRDPRRYVSAVDVLDGKVEPLHLQRKLVLIGTGALAMVDYQSTPLGERMPGSEIFAQVLENLYDQSWLMRPRWAPALELAAFVLLGLALVRATPRWKPANAALLAVGAIALPIAFSVTAFAWRRWAIDAAAPSLGLLVLFSVLLLLTLADAGRQRRRLERVIQDQREQAAYIAGEVQAAKRIQTGFLPRADALAGEWRVELAASMTPARDVGGDLYDFFLLDERRLFFMIGDVAGKGLSASMFMAVSKALYKSGALRSPGAAVGDLMRAANDDVSRDNPEMFFVTAFAAVLDLESGALAYSNAGQDRPYVLGRADAGLARLAGATGPPLCTVERFPYDEARQSLHAGDIVCLVTDGVADTQDPQSDRYGSARLEALLARLASQAQTARSVVDAVTQDLRQFARDGEPADDVTVMAVRWLGPRAAA